MVCMFKQGFPEILYKIYEYYYGTKIPGPVDNFVRLGLNRETLIPDTAAIVHKINIEL